MLGKIDLAKQFHAVMKSADFAGNPLHINAAYSPSLLLNSMQVLNFSAKLDWQRRRFLSTPVDNDRSR